MRCTQLTTTFVEPIHWLQVTAQVVGIVSAVTVLVIAIVLLVMSLRRPNVIVNNSIEGN